MIDNTIFSASSKASSCTDVRVNPKSRVSKNFTCSTNCLSISVENVFLNLPKPLVLNSKVLFLLRACLQESPKEHQMFPQVFPIPFFLLTCFDSFVHGFLAPRLPISFSLVVSRHIT